MNTNWKQIQIKGNKYNNNNRDDRLKNYDKSNEVLNGTQDIIWVRWQSWSKHETLGDQPIMYFDEFWFEYNRKHQ